jgi:hypothetical protein
VQLSAYHADCCCSQASTLLKQSFATPPYGSAGIETSAAPAAAAAAAAAEIRSSFARKRAASAAGLSDNASIKKVGEVRGISRPCERRVSYTRLPWSVQLSQCQSSVAEGRCSWLDVSQSLPMHHRTLYGWHSACREIHLSTNQHNHQQLL